jgi:hypothetical protein
MTGEDIVVSHEKGNYCRWCYRSYCRWYCRNLSVNIGGRVEVSTGGGLLEVLVNFWGVDSASAISVPGDIHEVYVAIEAWPQLQSGSADSPSAGEL